MEYVHGLQKLEKMIEFLPHVFGEFHKFDESVVCSARFLLQNGPYREIRGAKLDRIRRPEGLAPDGDTMLFTEINMGKAF